MNRNKRNEKDQGEEQAHDSDGRFGETLKKLFNTGLGAAFVTEETIKGLISELPIPKEILNNLVQNAKATKKEAFKAVEKAVADYLNQLNFQKELQKVVEKFDINIEAKISLTRKESSPTQNQDRDKDKDKWTQKSSIKKSPDSSKS